MEIKEITASDRSVYNDLAREKGTIFNRLEWLDLFGKKVKIFGLFDIDNNLLGGFHLYKSSYWGLNSYRNPPYTPFFGPFLKNVGATESTRNNIRKKHLRLIAEFLQEYKTHLLLVTLNSDIVDCQPFLWNKFRVNVRYTYKLDLTDSIDSLWGNLSTERRNDINKAEKDQIELQADPPIDLITDLVKKSFKRQNKRREVSQLNKLLSKFSESGQTISFAAFSKGIPLAVSFCIHDNQKAFYVVGGYDHQNRHHGAGALTLWECIKSAHARKLNQFDFDGSMKPGIERYFRGFGGKLTPFYRIQRSNFLIRNLLNLFGDETF